MKQYIIFLFSIIIYSSYAQENQIFIGKIVDDTNSFKKRTAYISSIPSILKSPNKIELRIITSPSFSGSNFLIFSYDSIWKVSKTIFNPTAKKYEIIPIHLSYPIDSLFQLFVNHRVFSLQSQDDLNMNEFTYSFDPKTNDFIGTGMDVSDGITYTVEYKVGKYLRRYVYSNPEDYLEHYKLIPDLKDFVAILKIIENIK